MNNYTLKNLLSDCGNRRVVALDAPMGTGKTTLVRHLVEEMGTDDIVNSPTFSIVNVYDTRMGRVNHFDCYRLKDIREAYDMGTEEYLYSGDWCFIEWPELITPLLPDDTVWIHIRTLENGEREYTVE